MRGTIKPRAFELVWILDGGVYLFFVTEECRKSEVELLRGVRRVRHKCCTRATLTERVVREGLLPLLFTVVAFIAGNLPSRFFRSLERTAVSLPSTVGSFLVMFLSEWITR